MLLLEGGVVPDPATAGHLRLSQSCASTSTRDEAELDPEAERSLSDASFRHPADVTMFPIKPTAPVQDQMLPGNLFGRLRLGEYLK